MQTNDRAITSRINSFTWHRFASVIQAKSGVSITGFGSPLVHKEDVLVPLYLEGEEDEPCRILLQFPVVQVSLKYPYDSLIDRTWATVSTLRFLEDRSQVPVPHVYYFFLEGVDVLGGNCPWIILERLPGMSLSSWIPHLSTSQIKHIGQQWGNFLAVVQSFRFESVGALRTIAKGNSRAIERVGADPDGNHLTADHYSSPSRTHGGAISRPRDKPKTSVDHLLSLASTATISLMDRLPIRTEDHDYETRENYLWNLKAYISMRHLHGLIPQYTESNILENYFTFDLPNFELGNINIDSNGYICGIVDWSGVNIGPSHIAFRFPRSLQNSPLVVERQPRVTGRNQEKLRALEHSVMTQFEQVVRKKGVLTLSTVPGGVGMAAVWAKGSKAKDFERLLYRFTGDVDSADFRLFLTYAQDSWAALFPEGRSTQNQNMWRKHVQKTWDALTMLYPRQCSTPLSPIYPNQTYPPTPPVSDTEATPKKAGRFRRLRSERSTRLAKPEISSFEFDSPTIGDKIKSFTDHRIRGLFSSKERRSG